MSKYWNKREQLQYYSLAVGWAVQYGRPDGALLDVGGGVQYGAKYLERLQSEMACTSVELSSDRGDSIEGVELIEAAFATWKLPRVYDVVLCLQCLEHIAAAAQFTQKLFQAGRTVIISVPYRWPAGSCPGHLHDPIDERKLHGWTGRLPTASEIVTDGTTRRLVSVYIEGRTT